MATVLYFTLSDVNSFFAGEPAQKPASKSGANHPSDALLGKWNGTMKVGANAVPMELNLTRKAGKWSAEAKFDMGTEVVSNPIENLEIVQGDISFKTEIGGAQAAFKGKLEKDKLKGSVEAFKNDRKIDSGTWNLERSKK